MDAPAKAADRAVKLVAVEPIWHDGDRVMPGGELTVTARHASTLLASGAAVKPPAKTDPAKTA